MPFCYFWPMYVLIIFRGYFNMCVHSTIFVFVLFSLFFACRNISIHISECMCARGYQPRTMMHTRCICNCIHMTLRTSFTMDTFSDNTKPSSYAWHFMGMYTQFVLNAIDGKIFAPVERIFHFVHVLCIHTFPSGK